MGLFVLQSGGQKAILEVIKLDETNVLLEIAKLGLVPVALSALWVLWRDYKALQNAYIADLRALIPDKKPTQT